MKYTRQIFLAVLCILLAAPASAQKNKKKNTAPPAQANTRTITEMEQEALFIEALQQRLMGNSDEAISILKSLLNKDPKNDAIAFELTRLFYEKSDLASAKQYGELAVKLNPNNEWYYIYLAETKAEMGDYDGSAEVYSRLIKQFPKELDYYFDWAYMLGSAKKYQEALDVYKQLEQKIGMDDDILLQKQALLLKLNKTTEAAEDVQKMIREYPGDYRYYGMLAELYESNNMLDKALDAYKSLLKLDPGNSRALSAMANIYRKQGNDQKYRELLTEVFSNKETDIDAKILGFLPFLDELTVDSTKGPEVLKMADMIVAAHPNDPKSRAARADVLFNMGKKEEAKAEYINAVETGECPMTVWLQLFILLFDDKEYTTLKQYAGLGMEKNPKEPIPALYKGLACQQLKDFTCATQAYKTGAELADFNGTLKNQILTSLGDSYYELKDFERSDSAYEAALELDPNNPFTLNNYAYYLSERGEHLEKAERMSKKSLLLEDDNASFLDTYGWIMYKQKKYNEAKQYIEQALELTQGNDRAVLLDHYGDVMFRLGNVDEAVKNWQSALEKTEGDKSQLELKIKTRSIPEIK